jgi:hypothetical protein
MADALETTGYAAWITDEDEPAAAASDPFADPFA